MYQAALRAFLILIVMSPLGFFNASSHAQQAVSENGDRAFVLERSLGREAADRLLRFSGKIDETDGDLLQVPDVRLVIIDRMEGRTSLTGQLTVTPDGILRFEAERTPRFEPGETTLLSFGIDDTPPVLPWVHTGRWIRFFDILYCPGQVYVLPGESQCI